MRRVGVLALVVVSSLGLVEQQPVLNADSLDDLHDSADRVKWSLRLSPDEFASLEQALDVLVGDDARRVVQALETMEAQRRPLPPAVRLAVESRVLAPVEGMSFEGLVTAAVDKAVERRTGLLGDLRAEKAAMQSSRRQLQKIEVVSASYWSSVATGEHEIDFTIRNGSEQTIAGLVLDCRLIDTVRRQTRERGSCRVDFSADLPAGLSAMASAPVAWEARQRLGWVVEARPIRAFGPDGDTLWEVSSEFDPRAGRLAETEDSIADLDDTLEALRVDGWALR
jgi:hypothetical protein